MTSSNIEFTAVRETVRGTTPVNPRMRKKRFTGDSLEYKPEMDNSEEVRDDRMNSDSFKTGEVSGGSVNFELSFPVEGSPEYVDLCSVFCSDFTTTPSRDNDGVAASAITSLVSGTQTANVAAGPVFPSAALVAFTGFADPANNVVRKVSASSGTAPVFAGGSAMVADAAPAASARMKLVGLEGALADIKAVADGLTATNTFAPFIPYLPPGTFIKIGGVGPSYRFDSEANNALVRVVAVAANKLTLDNLPAGWTADAGAGKTIRLWIPDDLRNAKTLIGQTFQRRFSAQGTPTCIKQAGMVANQYKLEITAKRKATYSITYAGMSGAQDTTSLDAVPDPETATAIMAAGVNVGRVNEAGARLKGPNFCQSVALSVNNNIEGIDAVDSLGPADQRYGDFDVTVELNTAFGDNSLLTRYFAGTPTSANWPVIKDGQALVFQVPRMIYTGDGNPNAGGKNQTVVAKFSATASKDPLTASKLILSRFERYEA